MRFCTLFAIFLSILSQGAFAQPSSGGDSLTHARFFSAPPKAQGVGMRVASQAALGKITVLPINYVEAAVIGFAIITNNNDNDGQPATFTGGSGSNMAAGG